MKYRQSLYVFFLMVCVNIQVSAQNNDTIVSKLVRYVSMVDHFSKNLPQEEALSNRIKVIMSI